MMGLHYGSKGLKLDGLIKNDRWLTGPKFLWEEDEYWPAMVEILILKDDDPEVRKENQIYVTSARRYYGTTYDVLLAGNSVS